MKAKYGDDSKVSSSSSSSESEDGEEKVCPWQYTAMTLCFNYIVNTLLMTKMVKVAFITRMFYPGVDGLLFLFFSPILNCSNAASLPSVGLSTQKMFTQLVCL